VTPYATAHRGPKGGTEYRIWTGPATFRVVSKFKAWSRLSDDERAHAAALEATRKASRSAAADNVNAWRHITRGGV
jgi:hypothetical protein